MELASSPSASSPSVCSSGPGAGFLLVLDCFLVGCDFFGLVFDATFFAAGFLAFLDFGSGSSSDSAWEPLKTDKSEM